MTPSVPLGQRACRSIVAIANDRPRHGGADTARACPYQSVWHFRVGHVTAFAAGERAGRTRYNRSCRRKNGREIAVVICSDRDRLRPYGHFAQLRGHWAKEGNDRLPSSAWRTFLRESGWYPFKGHGGSNDLPLSQVPRESSTLKPWFWGETARESTRIL